MTSRSLRHEWPARLPVVFTEEQKTRLLYKHRTPEHGMRPPFKDRRRGFLPNLHDSSKISALTGPDWGLNEPGRETQTMAPPLLIK